MGSADQETAVPMSNQSCASSLKIAISLKKSQISRNKSALLIGNARIATGGHGTLV